jgi:hypothetical protein
MYIAIAHPRARTRVGRRVGGDRRRQRARARVGPARDLERAIYISIDRWEAEQSARESKAGF